jgi:hypothetical protein
VAAASDPGKDDYLVHGALVRAVEKKLGCRKAGRLPEGAVRLVRKSFDARKRRDKFFVYVVDVDAEVLAGVGIRVVEQQGQVELLPAVPPMAAAPPKQVPMAAAASGDPVVVVGSGPAGLFAALAVAEAGLPCVLLERGKPVEARGRDIGALFVRGQGNPESNLCYGEGGAGTWSDGKLTTRIGRNSEPVRHVLETLCKLGAPEVTHACAAAPALVCLATSTTSSPWPLQRQLVFSWVSVHDCSTFWWPASRTWAPTDWCASCAPSGPPWPPWAWTSVLGRALRACARKAVASSAWTWLAASS